VPSLFDPRAGLTHALVEYVMMYVLKQFDNVCTILKSMQKQKQKNN
jgi:hypothetical protein